jgi:hypothetical protein
MAHSNGHDMTAFVTSATDTLQASAQSATTDPWYTTPFLVRRLRPWSARQAGR